MMHVREPIGGSCFKGRAISLYSSIVNSMGSDG